MSPKDKDVIFELVMQEMAKIVYERLLSLYESVMRKMFKTKVSV